MKYNRKKFAAWLGVAIVAFHIFLSFFLWLAYKPMVAGVVSGVEIEKIALPLTISTSISIVAWFNLNGSDLESTKTLALPFVVLILMVVGAMGIGLLWEPIRGVWNDDPPAPSDVAYINSSYAYIETVLGGIFYMLFNELYKTDDE